MKLLELCEINNKFHVYIVNLNIYILQNHMLLHFNGTGVHLSDNLIEILGNVHILDPFTGELINVISVLYIGLKEV